MGLLLALQLVDLFAGGTLLVYLATESHRHSAGSPLRNLPFLWILGGGAALRGVGSLVLRSSTRSFRLIATPLWVVVISLCVTISAIVELVQWRASAPPPPNAAAERAETRLLRLSIGAVVWLCLVALAQEGLMRASQRHRALRLRRPSDSRLGVDSPPRTRLLDDPTADVEVGEEASGVPDRDAGGARGLRGKASRIYGLARPEWPGLSVGLVALLGSSLSNLLIPKFFGNLINSVVDRDGAQLTSQTTTLVLILVAGALLTFVRAFLFNSAGERVVARLRGLLFARMLSQDASFFDAAKSGELVSRLTSDCTKLQVSRPHRTAPHCAALRRTRLRCARRFLQDWTPRRMHASRTLLAAQCAGTLAHGWPCHGSPHVLAPQCARTPLPTRTCLPASSRLSMCSRAGAARRAPRPQTSRCCSARSRWSSSRSC